VNEGLDSVTFMGVSHGHDVRNASDASFDRDVLHDREVCDICDIHDVFVDFENHDDASVKTLEI
jgi:hypothetical protein